MPLTLDKIKNEDLNALKNAIESGDSDQFSMEVMKIIIANNNELQQNLIKEAKTFNAENADASILAQRGFAVLTSEETKYYNEVKDKHSFSGLELPKSIFERVFEDLENNHPLLSEILFQNVTGTTEWIVRTDDVEDAWWGPLCEEIKKKLDSSFKTISTTLYKVSAYVPVCKGMLELGPVWLDKYVRTILAEAISKALEKAIIDGTGKDQPIGMNRKNEDQSGGTHVEKSATKITDLTPETIGSKILAPLRKGKTTPLDKLLVIVNEEAYYAQLFKFLVVQDKDGIYHKQDLPFNCVIIPSAYVPANKMIIGEGKNYFMGIGSELKIDHSDEFRFLDDQRVYLAKQYANGRARKDEDFIVFDISKLELKTAAQPGA